jgi:hypothetical protein
VQKAATTTAVVNNNKRPVAYAFAYVNSQRTKDQYPKRLRMFFDYIGLEPVTPPDAKKNVKTTREESERRKQKFMEELEQQARTFLERAREDHDTWASEQLIFYLEHHKQRVSRKEIAAGTLHNLLKPIKLFIEAYRDVDATIDWKRIKKALPRPRLYSHDRCPSIEEIRKLVQFPDHNRRIRAIVYVMCSSGVRLGAWDFMKVKHITPIKDEKTGEIKAAKLLVYAGEDNDEYITFMTGEAYKAVKEYLDFRASYGEEITGNSWVLRTEFRTTDIKRKKHYGNVSKIDKPEQFHSEAIGRFIVRALQKQGIRDELPEGQRRYDFRGVHGMRKWFKTRAEQAMLRTNVELLMGHDIGLSTAYYKASEYELYIDYLRAIPYLSINDENAKDYKNLKEQQEASNKELEETKTQLQRMQEEQQEMRELLNTSLTKMMEMVRATVDNSTASTEEDKKQKADLEEQLKRLHF